MTSHKYWKVFYTDGTECDFEKRVWSVNGTDISDSLILLEDNQRRPVAFLHIDCIERIEVLEE